MLAAQPPRPLRRATIEGRRVKPKAAQRYNLSCDTPPRLPAAALYHAPRFMNQKFIPGDVAQFVTDKIDSGAELEALLLLRNAPDRE